MPLNKHPAQSWLSIPGNLNNRFHSKKRSTTLCTALFEKKSCFKHNNSRLRSARAHLHFLD